MPERWSDSPATYWKARRLAPAPRSPHRALVLAALALGMLAASCQLAIDTDDYSFPTEPPASDERDDLAGAEGSEPSMAAATACMADSALASVCEGTWSYRQWASCAVSEAGPVTPSMCTSQQACIAWQECRDWSFGPGTPATQVTVYRHQVATCRERNCFDACIEEAANIDTTLAELRASVPPEHQAQVRITQQDDVLISSRRYSPGFLEDDKFDEIRECTVTFEYPTPASGQAAVCGCATLGCRSPACGADAIELTSPSGVSFDVVRALDPDAADTPVPSCSSCDAPLDPARASGPE